MEQYSDMWQEDKDDYILIEQSTNIYVIFRKSMLGPVTIEDDTIYKKTIQNMLDAGIITMTKEAFGYYFAELVSIDVTMYNTSDNV